MPIDMGDRWVVFDLGETLVDETRNWRRWAEYLGVSELSFFATLGAVIAAGRPHTDVFSFFRADFDLAAEERRKARAGLAWGFDADDLYDDALPTLTELRQAGLRLAIMANQPLEAGPFLATLPVDSVATSAEWGVAKPDPAFFRRVCDVLAAGPDCIAYVGDRVDNDVLPSRTAGMVAVHLRRGPWGTLQAESPRAEQAHLRIDTLMDLCDGLRRLGFISD
ncbi:MAG TPA: HAD family hydrolase [Mycobacteriales bacterium]|nr:HAD family hydrolase [Mycobacteriales bacterium]